MTNTNTESPGAAAGLGAVDVRLDRIRCSRIAGRQIRQRKCIYEISARQQIMAREDSPGER